MAALYYCDSAGTAVTSKGLPLSAWMQEPPQLPGLNLPELPGPLPLWASKQPRLSSWLSRGEIALGHAAKVCCALVAHGVVA
jgi:hypothetical protein